MPTRLSINLLAPVLFGVPVLAVGLWLSLAWNAQSKRAVAELAEQGIQQIHQSASTKITDVLSTPVQVCRVNEHLVASGLLPLDDLPAWRPTILRQAEAFDTLSSIAWGGADGRSAWVTRYADGSAYWALKADGDAPTMQEWRLGADGQPTDAQAKTFDFDVGQRPWFTTPRDAGGSAWSAPYVWVGGVDSSGVTLGISYGIPLYGDSGEFIGVVDADFSLNDLSEYLGRQSIGKTGVAALLSPDGRLLATSADAAVATQDGGLVRLADSDNPLLAAAGGVIEQRDGAADALVPLLDEPHYVTTSRVGDGVGLDWTLVTIVPESDFTAHIEREYSRSWLTSLIAMSLAVAIGLFAARWLVRPLNQLVTAVRRIGQGDLDTQIEVRHAPEYVNLAAEVNRMAAGLQDRMRMQKSLSLAMEVQRNLLPTDSPELPGLEIAGHSTYCDETGGDYYDFLDVSGSDQHTAVLVIGDVMGHGVAAALLMATARGILRSRSAVPGSLADFLTHLNDMLVEDTQGERFMTMLLVTVSSKTHELRWASAGHGPPMIYDPTKDTFFDLEGGGLPLGLMDGEDYEEYQLPPVGPGSVIFVATDGLEETMNARHEQFGIERLQSLVRENAAKPAEQISQTIRQAIATYRGAVSQADDLTFVVAKVLD
ncbi:Phosphoserine phosphatase RsbU [Posidoniimonas corsicana]|uniref:Phosphoserine phosphatase RsbU n=1 Tax=Posidoniimonas corsicana TaxID=1938618 RepID=A0A5C5V3R1_9BACT|nr:SpoIIE family protein phosphatase [Posidoniimonas corsicana]TWT32325.1 Phosphoserine phosphatase RsbU [Posidoniimonas corsicana]